MGHILNHNRTPFLCKLDNSEYWDFFLDCDINFDSSQYDYDTVSDRCLIAHIDFGDACCVWFENIYSKPDVFWESAINDGLNLENIGFTGVDNGLLTFDKHTITNADFINLFKNSTYNINKENRRLTMKKIGGNNGIFLYSNDLCEEGGVLSARLNGGFYQGFYKSGDYEVLPNNFYGGVSFEIVLKPHTFDPDGEIRLNDRHPENKGIILYLGARAENKWWNKFNVGETFERIYNTYFAEDYVSSEYFSNGDINASYFADIVVEQEIPYNEENECCKQCNCDDEVEPLNPCNIKFKYPEALNTYQSNAKWFSDTKFFWEYNERLKVECAGDHGKTHNNCNCNGYFLCDYLSENYPECDCIPQYTYNGYAKQPDFINVNEVLFTKDGRSVEEPNLIEIETDNKFLIFDRTEDGFTVEDWKDGDKITLTDIKVSEKENYFLLFDRTCNGKTVQDFEKGDIKKYNIYDDLYRNAFAIKITEDGSIGYKYLIENCDGGESEYKILSEYSNPKVVTDDEWNNLHIKIIPIGRSSYDACQNKYKPSHIVVMIYVNGKLRMVSKELPPFNFRYLNDTHDKQEAVPFNISLGGGTQGLCDVIYYDYNQLPTHVLPLEKEFGGTFSGYIKSFKIYSCPIKLSEIQRNTKVESLLLSNKRYLL